jgi:hypothetical protein
MILGAFSTTHCLNVSHVSGNPNHLTENNNFAWPRAKASYVGGFFDAQRLVHYQFISDRCTLNKEMYVAILRCLGDSVTSKRPKNGHETVGSFSTTTQLHVCGWWPSKLCGFAASAIFPGPVTVRRFPASATKTCSERATIRERHEVSAKATRLLTDVKNGFSTSITNLYIG